MERMNGTVGVIVSSLAVVLVVMVGWFVFVSPQRSKADDLSTQVDSVNTELTTDQALLGAKHRSQTKAASAAAERAMPDQPQVSEILRQLNALAAQSRTELDSITPGAITQVGSSQAIPISLTFKGRYFGLQKLLKLMRKNADVVGGKLVSKGRL